MDNAQRLIEQYKNKVINIGIKNSFNLFEDWLKKDYVISTNFEECEDIKRAAYIEILSSNRLQGVKKESLKFLCFIIKNEGEGEEYYKLLHSKGHECNIIYAVFEEKTNYIGSNCGKLFLDLVIERGIEEKDYQQNSIKLIEYLSRIEALEKGWY